ARVKGKTENDLAKLPFRETFAFRPGFIKPTQGLTKTHSFYQYINWLFPIGRAIYPKAFCTMRELGLSMINVAKNGYSKRIIEGTDIIALGHQ
ncbi:MAG: epimerase, partial [Flavipsychrobacter sp.]|nr:epimerase [Flavipsychrobacter sp.]